MAIMMNNLTSEELRDEEIEQHNIHIDYLKQLDEARSVADQEYRQEYLSNCL